MNDTEIKIEPFDCEKYGGTVGIKETYILIKHGFPQVVAAKILSRTTCLQYDNCKDRNNCIRPKPNQK